MSCARHVGPINYPVDYSDGTAFYFPGAVVGEAVLIRVTSQTFPSDIKTYITYNVATAGNFDGTRLRSSQPPPYYNTIPVEGKFLSLGTANPSYSGLEVYPVFCDSLSTPSIGLPPFSESMKQLMLESHAEWLISKVATDESWTAIFEPVQNEDTPWYGVFWGPNSVSLPREIYLGTNLPNGVIEHRLNSSWLGLEFDSGISQTTLMQGLQTFIKFPMEGGNGAIQLLLLATTDRFASEIYARPAPNLLLEAAIEAYEGRAILSSHLLPLCDLNENGRIDQEDVMALQAKVLCGMITY